MWEFLVGALMGLWELLGYVLIYVFCDDEQPVLWRIAVAGAAIVGLLVLWWLVG